MNNIPYTPPNFQLEAFNCPICNAYANQSWIQCQRVIDLKSVYNIRETFVCSCSHCHNHSIWFENKMIYPNQSVAPLPNADLPNDIKPDFEEARQILNQSPRGAAALLRLCIQKLCKHLGEPGKDINTDIGSLVKKGLNPKIQKSLDIVRVIGNEAVHPGQIDLKDDQDTSIKLFSIINVIVEAMITHPKMIDLLYDKLPESKKEAIEKRDEK